MSLTPSFPCIKTTSWLPSPCTGCCPARTTAEPPLPYWIFRAFAHSHFWPSNLGNPRLALRCCRVMSFRIRFSSFYAYCICAADFSRTGTTVTFLCSCGVTAIAIFCHSPRSCRSDWRSSNPAFILILIFCLPLSRGLMTGRLRALLPCYVPRLGFPHGSDSCFRTWRLVRYLAIGRYAVKPLTGARRTHDRPR